MEKYEFGGYFELIFYVLDIQWYYGMLRPALFYSLPKDEVLNSRKLV